MVLPSASVKKKSAPIVLPVCLKGRYTATAKCSLPHLVHPSVRSGGTQTSFHERRLVSCHSVHAKNYYPRPWPAIISIAIKPIWFPVLSVLVTLLGPLDRRPYGKSDKAEVH